MINLMPIDIVAWQTKTKPISLNCENLITEVAAITRPKTVVYATAPQANPELNSDAASSSGDIRFAI